MIVLPWIVAFGSFLTLYAILRIERFIMSNQEELDTRVATLNAAVAAVVAEVASLKDQIANAVPVEVPVNFDGLDAAVKSVQDIVPPVEPPAA